MGLRGPNASGSGLLVHPELKPKRRRKARAGISRADAVIDFIEGLKITAGMHAGRAFKLRQWQRDIIAAIYREEDGKRVVRQALVCVPRKNGKSSLAAALALAHLVGPETEPRGQIYSAAADRQQAGILYDEMKAMLEADPELSSRVVIRDFNKSIEDSETGTRYFALSADARKAHGLNPSFVVMDELAQWPNRELYDALLTGSGARAQPLYICISTKSPNIEHVMSEVVRYGERVNEGDIKDKTFHATIYAAEASDDPWSEDTWKKCNPAYGDFRSAEEFRVAADQAKRIPGRQPAFNLLYLNRAVDVETRFLPRAEWEACKVDNLNIDHLRGERCYLGLDLSATIDLTGLAAYFPDSGSLFTWGWLPAEGLGEAENRDHAPYKQWARQGDLETTPGRAIDKRWVVRRLGEITGKFRVECCFADRWRLDEIKRLLDEEGVRLKLIEHGQGWKDMAPSIDAFEAVVLSRELKHRNHPPMNMCMSNASVITDPAGNRKLVKNRAYGRIDLLIAAIMAVGGGARAPKTVPVNVRSMIV